MQREGSTTKYFIHYMQWSRKYDIWLGEDKMARPDDVKKMEAIKNGPVKSEPKGTKKSGTLSLHHDSGAF